MKQNDQELADVFSLLMLQALGYPISQQDEEYIQRQRVANDCTLKGRVMKSLQENQAKPKFMTSLRNMEFEVRDAITEVFISNNEKFILLLAHDYFMVKSHDLSYDAVKVALPSDLKHAVDPEIDRMIKEVNKGDKVCGAVDDSGSVVAFHSTRN